MFLIGVLAPLLPVLQPSLRIRGGAARGRLLVLRDPGLAGAESGLHNRHSSSGPCTLGNLLKIPKQRIDRSFGGYAMYKTGLHPGSR